MTNRTCLPKENPPHPSHPAALSPKRTTTVLWILFINQSFAIYHHHQHHQCAMVQLLSVDTHGSPWWRHGARTMTVSPVRRSLHCNVFSLKTGHKKTSSRYSNRTPETLSLSPPCSCISQLSPAAVGFDRIGNWFREGNRANGQPFPIVFCPSFCPWGECWC